MREAFSITPPGRAIISGILGRLRPLVALALLGGLPALASAQLPAVTVMALEPGTAESAWDSGSFMVVRTGGMDADLTVFYTVAGTATPGADDKSLPGSVTIPVGASSALVPVIPAEDTWPENPETVTLTLSPSPEYSLGTPSSATVTIKTDEAQPEDARDAPLRHVFR